MKFKFKIQQYQTDAVEQTVNVFAGQLRSLFKSRVEVKRQGATAIYE